MFMNVSVGTDHVCVFKYGVACVCVRTRVHVVLNGPVPTSFEESQEPKEVVPKRESQLRYVEKVPRDRPEVLLRRLDPLEVELDS